MYRSLDNGLEVRGVRCNTSQAFDKLTRKPDTQIKPIRNFGKFPFNKMFSKKS